MKLTIQQKSTIERVINAFETGTADGDYGCISIYSDGPHDIRQITYGRAQTTEYGNLRELVRMYVDAAGTYSGQLSHFADMVGSVPLTDNNEFKVLLRNAGRKDPIMQKIQDEFFKKRYFVPAMKWADNEGFKLPLSGLVIYDSFIHSGSILWVIRQRFSENPPSLGGEEKAWITAYVRERHEWLKSHPRPVVRASCYRTEDLKREIARGNWELSQLPIVANGVEVYPKT
ncbi:chitosanase [Candidatus Poribacteria bacterium]|nr:chitosanase [Candidatus Poribacteria bacterium]